MTYEVSLTPDIEAFINDRVTLRRFRAAPHLLEEGGRQRKVADTRTPQSAPVRRSRKVVGIGASAGGIEAFRRFFDAMPPDSGMAFVIALHMSADRKSMLREIIAGGPLCQWRTLGTGASSRRTTSM